MLLVIINMECVKRLVETTDFDYAVGQSRLYEVNYWSVEYQVAKG